MTPSATYAAALSEIDIFKELSDRDREAIAGQCAWRRCAPHERIIWHGERSSDVFFVVQGRVRAVNFSPNGKEVSFRDIGRGEVFGEFAALDGRERSANVLALEDSFVGSLEAARFLAVLAAHHQVAIAVLRKHTGEIRRLNDRVFEFSTLAVNNRIHAELLRLSVAAGEKDNVSTIDPAPTHAEIASRVSTHREAVSREFSRLAKTGIIRKSGRTLSILDCAWLKDAVALGVEGAEFARNG